MDLVRNFMGSNVFSYYIHPIANTFRKTISDHCRRKKEFTLTSDTSHVSCEFESLINNLCNQLSMWPKEASIFQTSLHNHLNKENNLGGIHATPSEHLHPQFQVQAFRYTTFIHWQLGKRDWSGT